MAICELCKGEASLYCVSDSAFLCWNCDTRVHRANFLVARHLRQTICCKCKELDGNFVSGVGFQPHQATCRSCFPEYTSDADSSSSTSSTCISSATSFTPRSRKKPRKTETKIVCSGSSLSGISGESMKNIVKSRELLNVDVKAEAEAVLANWCRKLGLKSNDNSITLALHAFSICLRKHTTLPFRVCLASSLWLSLKLSEDIKSVSSSQYLKRFEDITGIPAKLIFPAEKKISRALKINRKAEFDLKEGWAECCN